MLWTFVVQMCIIFGFVNFMRCEELFCALLRRLENVHRRRRRKAGTRGTAELRFFPVSLPINFTLTFHIELLHFLGTFIVCSRAVVAAAAAFLSGFFPPFSSAVRFTHETANLFPLHSHSTLNKIHLRFYCTHREIVSLTSSRPCKLRQQRHCRKRFRHNISARRSGGNESSRKLQGGKSLANQLSKSTRFVYTTA
jgi:hypothetical protein